MTCFLWLSPKRCWVYWVQGHIGYDCLLWDDNCLNCALHVSTRAREYLVQQLHFWSKGKYMIGQGHHVLNDTTLSSGNHVFSIQSQAMSDCFEKFKFYSPGDMKWLESYSSGWKHSHRRSRADRNNALPLNVQDATPITKCGIIQLQCSPNASFVSQTVMTEKEDASYCISRPCIGWTK